MVKFLIGLVTGVALVFLSIILLFVIALRFREKPPVIAADSVLVIAPRGRTPGKIAGRNSGHFSAAITRR